MEVDKVLAPSSPGFLLLLLLFAKDWKPPPLPGVLATTTTPAFDSDPEISDVDEDEPGGLVGTQVDVISPGGHSDAQTLAMMLQEQLDAINQEIRWGRVELQGAWGDGPFVLGHCRSIGSCPVLQLRTATQGQSVVTRQGFALILTPEGQGYR